MLALGRAALTVVLFYGLASALTLPDVDGRPVDPLSAKTAVVLFTRTDCPISNRYAPDVVRLHDLYAPKQVVFWLVYVDPTQTLDAIKRHIGEYRYPMRALLDRKHELVKLTGARTTPEVAVFHEGRLVYRGRIDDRYKGLGKMQPAATQHDLEQVLESITAGKRVAFRDTPAVGCVIDDLK